MFSKDLRLNYFMINNNNINKYLVITKYLLS